MWYIAEIVARIRVADDRRVEVFWRMVCNMAMCAS
jgi:hypothetical protein